MVKAIESEGDGEQLSIEEMPTPVGTLEDRTIRVIPLVRSDLVALARRRGVDVYLNAFGRKPPST